MGAAVTASSRALRIVLAYGLFASLWIYLSDQALASLLSDPDQLLHWSVYKGIAFVVLTSALLYSLTYASFRAIERRSGELRSARTQLERLNRLYSALSKISHAVVLCERREPLLQSGCQTLVEEGAVQVAWIGLLDPQTQRLVVHASYGARGDSAGDALPGAEGQPEAVGPSGMALRLGRPYVCNDLASDPASAQWRSVPLQQGLRSCAAFPLRVGGSVVGVLGVYAGDAGHFQQREVAVLEEAAMDLSSGLEKYEGEAARRAALELASKERAFSDIVVESMPGILYFYNEKLQLLRWNRNFERVSGYSAEEVGRMSPLEFFAPEDRAALAQRIAQVFESGEATIELSFLAKDGTRTPYFFTGYRIVHEGENCLAGVGIDISAQKRAQAQLMKLNETLEHRVQERTTELQASLRRAETADHLKSAFLATMSHELRTPLNSIIGFTGVLQGGLAGPVNQEQAKQLGMVRGSARHLLELINDVLDLSKIEAGELRIASDTFDLPASLERARASLAPAASKSGLALDSVIDSRLGPMVGDRRRVEQIVLNLLNNAVKFTDAGGVTMEAALVQEFPGAEAAVRCPAVRICVADTGIGIAPEHQAILFHPFRQIDNGLNREYEGTGLGLAICHRLVALMEGRIEVASTPGAGSRFIVTLPLAPRSLP